MSKVKMPDGVHQAGKVKIAVTLDKKVFDDVCCFASNRSWPFSVAVNDLLLCGILDMKDCGEFDLHIVQDNCNAVET